MSDAPDLPTVRRATFRIDPATRQQFLDVLAYLEERHWIIDPDMYRLDPAEMAALARVVGGNGATASNGTISATWSDLRQLQYALDAAGTYANRSGQPEIPGVGDAELASLMAWADEAMRWFRQPGGDDWR